MRITFWGAAQEVTGSMHLVEVNGARILLDCGMFQGRRAETYARNLRFPFDPKEIDVVVLSHAHIDHSGNLPNLIKQGFAGHVWSTPATRNLSVYMLQDSGKIQESDAEYLNQKKLRKGEPPVQPLYTREDARIALQQFVTIGFHRSTPIADGVELTFYYAGHILGAAFAALDVRERGSSVRRRLVFSGDVGREELAILPSPETVDQADILIMESTYGDRLHGAYDEARRKLREVVRDAARRRGKVIIPAFAVGRTQEIVYALNELAAAGDIPHLPIYVDSPLAVDATEVFRMHPEEWDEDVKTFLSGSGRRNPFDAPQIEYVRDQARSKQLNYLSDPAVIISASGMCENGRVLHHLKNNIENRENSVLFVSFQAENTLGRRLRDGAHTVKIFGEEHRVRAQIASIDGYSAHADQSELLEWVQPIDRDRLQHTFLVHGEPEAQSTLAGKLEEAKVKRVTIPQRGDSYDL
jgi:metallo-beta-lactamase family protein